MAFFSFVFFALVVCKALLADDIQEMYNPKQIEIPPSLEPTNPPLPLVQENDSLLLSELKGLLLVGSPSDVTKKEIPFFEGVQTKGIDIPGNEEILFSRLSRYFLNRPLTQKGISQIKREIAHYYQQQHHPLVMVIVPEQEVSNGVLQLLVLESRLGEVFVEGNCHTPTYLIEEWIRLEPGCFINEQTLIQDVGWINSNPFRHANVVYSPGEKVGTTDVHLRVTDRKPWRIYVGGDNTGTPNIGRARIFTGINFSDVFFPNNLFSYQYTTTSNVHRFQSHTMQYVAPLPWRHNLNVFGGYALVNPDITPFKSHGKSYQVSGRYGVPFWFAYPTLFNQITAEIGFDFKGTNNNVLFGDDNPQVVQQNLVNIGQFVLGGHASIEQRKQKIAIDAELVFSPGKMLSHQSKSDFEGLRLGASAHYLYGKLGLSHESPLPYRWSVHEKLRVQLSDANLLASEQFALGGYSTVRGYNERVVNGDSAACFNFELHTPSFAPLSAFYRKLPGEAFYFLAFFDAGHAWDHQKIPGFPKKQTLMGVGPGLRYQISSYFNLRFDTGFPLHSIQNEKKSIHFHVGGLLSY